MTEAQLDIVDVGRRGEGIAHHHDKTIFVGRTLPGEAVRAQVEGDRGTLTEVVKPSPDRVAPFCRHYESCGGCQLQHWREDAYREWKKGLIEQALRARGIAAATGELIDAHGVGRRRVSIHVRRKGDEVTAGFMAPRSHTLHDIDGCPILEPALHRAFDIARAIGATLGDCDVALTATLGGLDAAVKAERKIVEREHAKLAALATGLGLARLTVNNEVIITAMVPRIVMGKAQVAIPPGSFLQATEQGEEALAKYVCSEVRKAKRVADLFCGCGPFTFRLAETAKVDAFDSDRAAIAALLDAARNTQGLKPVTATVRDLFREPLVANELKDFDAVVFDPPRAGAEAQAKQLAKSKVKTVVAVSCDPQSFARDAAILIDGGYRARFLSPVDQFKWSSHVEIVASFEKTQSFARSTYDPSSVATTMRVPDTICGGTMVRTPFDRSAGLNDDDAVWFLIAGSVSTISSVTRCGSSMEMGAPLNMAIWHSMPSCRNGAESPSMSAESWICSKLSGFMKM